MTTVDEKVGARIRELREAKGWSQATLAQRLEGDGLFMSQQTIQKIEAGARPVRLTEGAQIAYILGVDVDSLVAQDIPEVDPVPAAISLAELLTVEWRKMIGAVTAAASLQASLTDIWRQYSGGLPQGLEQRVRELVDRNVEGEVRAIVDTPIQGLVNVFHGEDIRNLRSAFVTDPHSDEPIRHEFGPVPRG